MTEKFEMPIYICEDSKTKGNAYFTEFKYLEVDDDNEAHYGICFKDKDIEGIADKGDIIVVEKDAMIHGEYTYVFTIDEKDIRFGVFNLDNPKDIVIDFKDGKKERKSYGDIQENIALLGKYIKTIKENN